MYRPLIGITDVATPEQIQMLLAVMNEHGPIGTDSPLLHVGVMVSKKSLAGIPTKYDDVWPKLADIPQIFSINDPRLYTCIHYADYEDETTPEMLAQVVTHGGPNLSSIQLDMPWPDPSLIRQGIKEGQKDVEVILQIGESALAEEGFNVHRVCNRLDSYRDCVDRVLLDRSMGQGRSMKANGLIPMIRGIKSAHPKLGIIVAGGLGPKTLHLAEPIFAVVPDVSIDAQGKLRPSASSQDPLDIEMAAAYLTAALCHKRWSL